MIHMSRQATTGLLATAFLMSVLSTGTAYAHKNHHIGAKEHPAIKARHKIMEDTLFAAKQAGAMAKGTAAYDAARAELAMRLMSSAAHNMGNYFPRSSIPGSRSKSEASPKIWKNLKDFFAEINKFKQNSAAAVKVAGKGEAAFRGGFMKVMQSCKSCHESYRIKKK